MKMHLHLTLALSASNRAFAAAEQATRTSYGEEADGFAARAEAAYDRALSAFNEGKAEAVQAAYQTASSCATEAERLARLAVAERAAQANQPG